MTHREAALWAGCSICVPKPKEEHHFQIVKCPFLAHSAQEHWSNKILNTAGYTVYRKEQKGSNLGLIFKFQASFQIFLNARALLV